MKSITKSRFSVKQKSGLMKEYLQFTCRQVGIKGDKMSFPLLFLLVEDRSGIHLVVCHSSLSGMTEMDKSQ